MADRKGGRSFALELIYKKVLNMEDFKDKKVIIMGLGQYKEGSGISAAKFFISKGAKVSITDLKTKNELKAQLNELNKFCRHYTLYPIPYTLVLGRHRLSDFKTADIVVQNPGVRRESSYLLAARKAGARIVSDISVFLSLTLNPNIIGVTGTRGKSTTSALIYNMLKKYNKHAELGGNILRSPLTFVDKIHEDAPVVLELSSWQCESLEEIKKSPRIAVITNIMRDHLNTYKGMKEYAAAKTLIYKYQSPEDAVILNRDNPWTFTMGQSVPSQRFWFSAVPFAEENGIFVKAGKIIFRLNGKEEKVARASDIALKGEHNLMNALAAAAAAKVLGVKNSAIKKVLKNFKGLPNRMEEIREIKGIKFINDTTATTPDATIAAIKTLKAKSLKLKASKNIILIFGGSDKKLEYKEAAFVINKFTKLVVLLPGTAEKKIKKSLRGVELVEVKSMDQAVKTAYKLAQKGDIVLLSPGATSFGLFKNEFDRGEQFVKVVKNLR